MVIPSRGGQWSVLAPPLRVPPPPFTLNMKTLAPTADHHRFPVGALLQEPLEPETIFASCFPFIQFFLLQKVLNQK